MKYETLKNPVFVLTGSFVATHIFMLIIFAIDNAAASGLYSAFWTWDVGNWSFNILGGVWLIIACATLVLTIFFGIKENMVLSYSFGAAAGVFLAILIYMLTLVLID